MTIGNLELDRKSYSISRNGQRLQLTPREFQLLDLLARNQNIVLTREVILDRIWGLEADVSLKTIDATVKLLRKKLDSMGGKDTIRSIRGVGYTIES
ncbi:Response regulator ArlR [compost metagenome]